MTYLAMQARRSGARQAALNHNTRVLELAQRLELPGYEAVAEANLAWAALCEGHREDALHTARRARTRWAESAPAYPFQWVAIWPLLEALAAGDDVAAHADEIRDCAETLLRPDQQWLPDNAQAAVRELARSGGEAPLRTALACARELGVV